MRTVMWITGLVFIAFLGVFFIAPGEQRDALFAEVGSKYSEAGPMGVMESVSDGTFPGLLVARISEVREMAMQQIDAELSTIEDIRSGALKIGADEAPAQQPTVAPVKVESPEIAKPDIIVGGSASEVSTATADTTISSMPAVEPTDLAKPAATATLPQTEDMFSGIITREDREDQAADTSFWTEERIEEALENGEPTSGGKRMCLFGCD